jgi:hypothetical protein
MGNPAGFFRMSDVLDVDDAGGSSCEAADAESQATGDEVTTKSASLQR